MSELGKSARRAVGRLIAGKAGAPSTPGMAIAATALEALASVERAAGSIFVTGTALAGRPELAGAESGGAAAALGVALAGQRAALFVAGAEMPAVAPLLAAASRQRVPLVVHLIGGGIDAAWVGVAAGAAVWTPLSLAEAADLALVARRHAETALGPALVALLGRLPAALEETWRLDAAAILRRIGSPADDVHSAGPAEVELFGAHRRRVPRWHDAGERRRLGGGGGVLATAGRGAEAALFAPVEAARAEASAGEIARATGRNLPPVAGRKLHRARLALVAAGADAEIAAAVADALRAEKLDLGVVALRRLAPFPALELAERVASCKRVVVLERSGSGAAGAAFFDRVTTALAANGQTPSITRLVIAGDEASVDAGALADALRDLAERERSVLVLGLPAVAAGDPLPKRAAHADALGREAPTLAEIAPRRSLPAREIRPAGAVTVAVDATASGAGLAAEVARLLHATAGGQLRTMLELAPVAAGAARWERVTWARQGLSDPGGEPPLDLLVLPDGARTPLPDLPDGAALLAGAGPISLPEALVRRVVSGEVVRLEWSTVPTDTVESLEQVELGRERWLGAIVAALAERARLDVTPRKLRSARSSSLAALESGVREERLAALEAGAASVRPATGELSVLTPLPARPLGARGVPPSPPGAGALGDPVRFWDLAGLPVREGLASTLRPDPIFALGVAPAHSAPLAARPTRLPRFAPARCTGCGDCWSVCPHGAIAVRAVAPAAVLERGFAAATERGADAEPLRRFAGKLAGRWAGGLTQAPGAAGPALVGAAESLLAESKIEGERLVAALAAARALAEPFAAAPLAAPEPERAAGELLALAIDPDLCTGCGLCVVCCVPVALSDHLATPEGVVAARAATAAVAALPATTAATIARLGADERVGPVAAALLDAVATSFVGGLDGAEPGSGPRLAARQALALLGRGFGGGRVAALERTRDLRARLAEEVHGHLAGALPDRDLDALARGLDASDAADTDLAALAGRVAGAVEGGRVDVRALRRRVELARALADLEARLVGETGRPGRAPLTLVVGPGAALDWARGPVDNPFDLPVTLAPRAPLAVARGLARAEAERAIAEASVLRRARLELERPGEARAAVASRPAWSELDEAERALATPVVVLIDERAGAEELGVALEILAGDLPVVVAALAAPPAATRPSAWAALAYAAQDGVVAHATIVHHEALAAAAAAIAETRRGALLRLLAPSPELDGLRIQDVLEIARGAVDARGFPLGRRVAATPAATALRVDPEADATERELRHQAELASAEALHRQELTQLEGELKRRLAESTRRRLLELATRRRPGRARGA